MNQSPDERQGLPSASNWYRYELCAGSYQLGLKAKELGQEAFSDQSPEARRGTKIHEALATGDFARISESEKETVRLLEEKSAEQVYRIFGESKVAVLNEERLWFDDDKMQLSGKPDRIYYAGDKALIIDWKSGFSPVDTAEINPQLKVLAMLTALRLPQTKTIHVMLISSAYGPSEAIYDRAKLQAAYRDIIVTLKKINNPHAKFSPSGTACRYCPALLICPAVEGLLGPLTQLHYYKLPVGDAAADLLDRLSVVQKYLDEIRAYYSWILKDAPEAIPGWGLVPGTPSRTITDWSAARQILAGVIEPNLLDGSTKPSVTKLEKLLGAKGKLKELLGNLLILKYPEPSLKRIKDETNPPNAASDVA